MVGRLRLTDRPFASFLITGIKRGQRGGHLRRRHQHGPALLGQTHPVRNPHRFEDEVPRLGLVAAGRHAHGGFGRNFGSHAPIVITEGGRVACRARRTIS